MMLAPRAACPPLRLIAAVLVGGALAAGAANALNCYLDRDIDQVMRRTARRPLPAHTVTPAERAAVRAGPGRGVGRPDGGVTNLLATGLTAAAIVYYDVVYTWWLKRPPRTTRSGAGCAARRRC